MRSGLKKFLSYLWAAPCSAVGLALSVPVLICGGSRCVVDGALEVAFKEAPYRSRLPFNAITFGHVILGTDRQTLERLRAHEQVHVRQYERWGIFFFLAYPASSLLQWLRGKQPYWDNHFEIEARAESERKP
jgi:hypothetical protein